ncbi:hypothetical protein JCM18899A_33070 [Nocardioides sp. AN3]
MTTYPHVEQPIIPPRATRAHLSVSDLCEELGIARSTFYDWRAAHKAPRCIKLPNGALRIRRRDLDEWLEGREEPA